MMVNIVKQHKRRVTPTGMTTAMIMIAVLSSVSGGMVATFTNNICM